MSGDREAGNEKGKRGTLVWNEKVKDAGEGLGREERSWGMREGKRMIRVHEKLGIDRREKNDDNDNEKNKENR